MPALLKFITNTLSGIFKWFFSTLVIKFLIFIVIFIVLTEVVPLLIEIFLDGVDLNSLSGDLPQEVMFFLQPFGLDKGIPMILSAYMTRFMIRRIPFIG